MASPQESRSQQELAGLWRARLDKAKAAYDLAVAEFRRSAEEYRFRENGGPSGERSLREAIEAENSARQLYLAVLQTFTDLVLNGQAPSES